MKKLIAVLCLCATPAAAQTYDYQQQQNPQYQNPYQYNPYESYGRDQYGTRVAPSMPNSDANGNYCNPFAPVGYGGYHY